MADPAPATLHEVNTADDWPHELDDVVHRLQTPLPPLFANFANAATTDEFKQFVDTTLEASLQQPLAPEERALALVSKHVLSTVTALESLAGYEAADGLPRPKLPFVYSLIRAIVHAYNTKHNVLWDMPFAVPRGCGKHAGIATALVCRPLGKADIHQDVHEKESEDEHTEMQDQNPQVNNADVAMKDGSIVHGQEYLDWVELGERIPDGPYYDRLYQEYVRSHPIFKSEPEPVWELDYDIYGPFFYRRKDEDETEAEDVVDDEEITLPASAYLVAGSTKKSQVALPTFVVTDADNIDTLLASVLYQRHVWGIDTPAVGLCVSKASAIIRVVFGWLDRERFNAAGLPLAHIAVGCALDNDIKGGTFDLGTLSGALGAARFLLLLNDLAPRCDSSTRLVELAWRVDSDSSEKLSIEERTAEWARAHASMAAHDPSTQEDMRHEPDPLLVFTPTIPLSRPVVSTSALPHSSVTSGSSNSPSSQLSFQVETPPSSPDMPITVEQPANMARTPQLKYSEKAKSHSVMAKEKSRSILDSKCTTHAFLFDHLTIRLGRVRRGACPDQVPSADWELLHKNLERYDALTIFYWHPDWENDPEATVPKLWFSEEQRLALCQQYRTYREVGGETKPMQDPMKTILVDRLTDLVLSCTTQDMVAASAAGHPVKEAETRRVWDHLLTNFFVNPGQIVSPNIFLEYYVQLPRNHLLDCEQSTILEKAKSLASISLDLCQYEVAVASMEYGNDILNLPKTPYRADLVAKAKNARDHAEYAMSAAQEDLEQIKQATLESFVSAVQARATEEPIHGICDVLVVDALDWGKYDTGAKERFLSYVRHLDTAHTLQDAVKHHRQYHNGHGFICKLKTWIERRENALKPKPEPKPEPEPKSKPKPSPGKDSTPRKPSERISGSLTGLPYVTSRPCPTVVTRDLPDVRDPAIPSLVVEYKRADDETVASAVNQAYMFGCSSVDFHEAMGADPGRPVMILVVDGSCGSVNMAWKSKDTGITYILERGVHVFDITQPLQAYHFATFLIQLRVQINKDRPAISKEVVEHFKKTPLELMKKWTKTAQALEKPELHNPKLYKTLEEAV